MSTDLTGISQVLLDFTNVNDLTTKINQALDDLGVDTKIKWTFGTGVNQANVLFHEKVTVAQAANTTLNLYDSGTLEDNFGDLLTMEAIKLLYIKNTSADLTVSVFGGASVDLLIMGGTTDAQKLPPGAFMLWVCPTAAGIVTTTNKNLYLAVSAGTGSAIINVVALGLD
jgi:hypothetical protein